MKKPLIGMTSFLSMDKETYTTKVHYVDVIKRAGGIPVQLPATDKEHGARLIEAIDGLLIPGGADVSPSLYGEEPCPAVTLFRRENDLFEFELIRLAQAAGKPILAICRGMQVVNVAFGGTLYQDIPSQYGTKQGHYQRPEIRDEPAHKVWLTPGSKLAEIFGKDVVEVNTYHHQAVKDLAEGFLPVWKAADGLLEAMESEDGLIWCVQWHPEGMTPRFEEYTRLFKAFVERC